MTFLFIILVTLTSSTIAQQCSNKDNLRLVDGSHAGMGRLEVRNHEGEWGSVCPDRWREVNAAVACRQLCGDFESSDATSLPAAERFGPITNAISVFDTNCTGYENSFAECAQSWNTTGSCYEDAAVGLCCVPGGLCDGKNMFLAPRLRYKFRCDYDSYTVTLESPPSTGHGLVYPFELYSYTNPQCRDRKTNQNETHNWLTTKFIGDCGVKQEVIGGNFTYTHSVLIKGQTTGPAITRLFQWLLPVGCRVDRKLNKSIHLDTSNEGYLTNLTGKIDDLKLDMSIKVFKDSYYQTELETPVDLPVGTPIYIELSVNKSKLQGGDVKAKIIVTKCVSYPFNNSDSGLHHTVINERIVVDDGSQIFRTSKLNILRFKMQTFKIGINFREVYLSCGAYICPSSDKSDTCNDKIANAQHLETATRKLAAATAKGANASQQTKSAINVVSDHFGVVLPKFTAGQLTQEDVPELGEEDYLRTGRDNKLLYHFKASSNGNYIVSLYKGTGIL
jgi:hypothetical protein